MIFLMSCMDLVCLVRLIEKISYHQIKMKERDKRKNNFKTTYGLFEWLVILFSLIIAYSNLMRLMNHILYAFIGTLLLITLKIFIGKL
jgi:hypothetical protein